MLPIIKDVLKGLAHAQEKSWVHLDVKPDNAMLQSQNGGLQANQQGKGMCYCGTLGCMAPELVATAEDGFKKADSCCDTDSVAAMVLEMAGITTIQDLFGTNHSAIEKHTRLGRVHTRM